VRLLLDTHILIWLALEPDKLPVAALRELENAQTEILFSAINIWEIAIKHSLKRPDFTIRPEAMLNWARERGFAELPMTSEHGLAAGSLPLLHRDPFDRAMIGQAMVEGVVLLTADAGLAVYGDVVRVV
jgi:PIN domain nuclease of toxin-antitoxin system